MALSYSKKSKCQGCKALRTDKDADGIGCYYCALEFPVIFDLLESEDITVMSVPLHPRPNNVKCYKPRNNDELKLAKKEILRKTAKA